MSTPPPYLSLAAAEDADTKSRPGFSVPPSSRRPVLRTAIQRRQSMRGGRRNLVSLAEIQIWIGFAHAILASFAIAAPFITPAATIPVLCAMLAGAGLIKLAHALRCDEAACQMSHIIWAGQASVGAGLLLILPIVGLAPLGAALAFFFLGEAAAMIYAAGRHPVAAPFLYGVACASAALALVALVTQSLIEPWVLGLFIGIDFLIIGIAYVRLGLVLARQTDQFASAA